jgi:hypothetical protein
MALKLRDFDTGAEAIAAAAQGNGGKFAGFAPQVSWKSGEEKYVLFLLPMELTPTVNIHEWIDCGQKENGKTDWGFFLDRRDPVLGEDVDPLSEKGSQAKKRVMSAAVEVEPIMGENAKGRKRPTGFTVLTSTYDRKTDDGTEEVTQPSVGYVSQASQNFFNILTSFDADGEYEGTVFKVKRTDDKTYTFTPYIDLPVDFTNLIEYIDGVSYLSRNEEVWDELEPKLANLDTDEEKATAIGEALLERRLNELADKDEYDRKTAKIERVIDKFAGDKGKGKQERPARQSQRSASSSEAPASNEGGRSEASKAKFDKIKQMAAQKG